MRNPNSFLIVLVTAFVARNAFGGLQPPPTVPSTQAEVSGVCSSEDRGYADSGPTVASGSQIGISNAGEFCYSSASAQASFFVSSVSTSASISAQISSPAGSGGAQLVAEASATYELSWTDGNLSGDIIGPNDAPFGIQMRDFSFIYGTTYTITSLLTTDAYASIFDNAVAHGSSLWSDTFTFLGQPDGTLGDATFRVDFIGSLTAEKNVGSAAIASDAEAHVLATLMVNLPQGSRLETGSEGMVSTLPDEGSTLLLTGIAVTALAGWRRKMTWKRPSL